MIEPLPNWHPLLVHFPIALVFAAALFLIAARLAAKRPLAVQWSAAGHWALWLAAVTALAAALAGHFAFASVDHDAAGHAAMLLHRAWALRSCGFLVAVAAWAAWRSRPAAAGRCPVGWPLLGLVTVAAGLIAVTGWLGGELVFRHHIGYAAPPAAPGEAAPGAAPETTSGQLQPPAKPAHDHQAHPHAHQH